MATMKDVAEAAKVSVITVSRVINMPDKVKPATRYKVEQEMKALGFTPNIAAKNLVSRRTGIIDVYIPESIDLSNPFAMHFITGISEVLSKQMYSFLILRNRTHKHLCDGYIITGLLKDEIDDFYRYALENKRPIVLFGHTELLSVNCIDVNNVTGASMAVDHLINLGHKKIAMINVDEDKDYTIDRLAGYHKAFKDNGLPIPGNSVINAINNTNGGYEATLRLLKEEKFSAIFCATDTIALGAIRAARDLGKEIPKDLSIVGFDGLGHQLLANPVITTVQQPVFRIGSMLAELLLDQINGDECSIKKLVEPELLDGNSTAVIRE